MKLFTYCCLVLLLFGCSPIQTLNLSKHQAVASQSSATFIGIENIIFSGSDWRHKDLEHLQSITTNYFSNLYVDNEFLDTTEKPYLFTVEWTKRYVAHPYLKKNTLVDTVLRKRASTNHVPKMMISLTLSIQPQQIRENSQEVELRNLFGVLELNNERVENALSLGTSQLIEHLNRVTY